MNIENKQKNIEMSIAKGRLLEERRNWRRDRPHGFWARPKVDTSGATDLMKWECGIPGKEGVSI